MRAFLSIVLAALAALIVYFVGMEVLESVDGRVLWSLLAAIAAAAAVLWATFPRAGRRERL